MSVVGDTAAISIEPDKKTLVAKRGLLKSNLTRFETFVNDDKNCNKVIELEERVSKIENVFDNFNEIQSTLELLDPSEVQLNEREEFENRYFAIISKSKQLIKDNCKKSETASNVQSVLNRDAPQFVPQSACYQLPPISLPSFDGSYDKWSNFIDTFKILVHNNVNLAPVQKYHYLRSVLKGEAWKVVDSLEVNDSNYSIALDLLIKRYENKKNTIRCHMKGIFELPSVQKESHSTLRVFLDNFLKHYRCLINLGEHIDACSSMVIYLLLSKLDNNSKREWEIKTRDIVSPEIDLFIEFLSDRCLLLESLDIKPDSMSNKRVPSQRACSANSAVTKYFCILCNASGHGISYCNEFLKLNVNSRFDKAKQLNVCINCLKRGHNSSACLSKPCYCGKRHNKLLHFNNKVSKNESENKEPTMERHQSNNSTLTESNSNFKSNLVSTDESTVVNCVKGNCNKFTLLSTAQIFIYDSKNQPIRCRALLDNGSQSNFMSTKTANILQLSPRNIKMPIVGINSVTSTVNQCVQAKIKSINGNYSLNLSFLVINKITEDLPQQNIDISDWPIHENVKLADPQFNLASPIDILIGASVYYDILIPCQVKLGPSRPILQSTKLGFILGGSLCSTMSEKYLCNFAKCESQNLDQQLEAFWNVEECHVKENVYTKEELECEEHFAETYKRDQNGTFIVKLPFKSNVGSLGKSSDIAISRFFALEQRISKNPKLKEHYLAFMKEYEDLGHMTQIKLYAENQVSNHFYLPHHCILKESSLTTKLRVVFNASSKSSSKLSLNDILKVGPCIQEPLFWILLRFRVHAIVFTADIAKMYRCILIDESQRDYQRIVYRDDPSEELRHYNLNTITYGTGPASFLATRCLKQLALDNKEMFSKASHSIMEDFYMDDWLSGSDDIETALTLIKDTCTILSGANFHLRQWTSNDPRVLDYLGKTNHCTGTQYFVKNEQDNKTLGIFWNCSSDEFGYSIVINENISKFSKRVILSIISQIFDILGLLGPVIIKAKIIMQQLWMSKVDWDSQLPEHLLQMWLKFYTQLPQLNEVKIMRPLKCKNVDWIEIHCFADASNLGYGAALYIRSGNSCGNISVQLACAKSRVAPIKSLSLPRLELCAGVLAAQLCHTASAAMKMNVRNVFYWTDSQIVLAWLAREPSSLKTFVSNRVSKIQSMTDLSQWSYVPSKENPADLISRGLNPSEIVGNSFWFSGPSWLSLDIQFWPEKISINEMRNLNDIPEVKVNVFTCADQSDTHEAQLFLCKYSSYRKLLAVTAYIIRFKNNALLPPNLRNLGSITLEESERALILLVKLVQSKSFGTEISALQNSKPISKKSVILPLNPMLDKNGLLLVGGRLSNSSLDFNAKHPIILPSNHHFTKLLIMYEHLKNLHAGPQLLLSTLRLRFWPLKGRSTVRNVLRKCLVCFRVTPTKFFQKMSDLPASRVNRTSRPFVVCGVDYAGPYNIKDSKFRNKKFIKAYICIFVCFNTKAVHIEVVSELSKEGFLNAFKRFVSRRGICSHIYSDCGSNFKAAEKSLSNFANCSKDSPFLNFLLENQIKWHFSPPRSPHFGGLWEAAVRLAKYHLKRIMQNLTFNYEDFYTICVQVESVLNSRPLYPLTEEPEDFEVITPGHFLIGDSLKSIPEMPLWDKKISCVSRYKHMQFIMQQFWDHWSSDYLSSLQRRSKWHTSQKNIAVGDLVLMHEDGVPPMDWKLGRIMETFPGKDGLVRVASVRTKDGVYRRSITKLSLLPMETEDEEV